MGSKPAPPPAPTIVMPTPTAPTLYRTMIPQESFQDVAALGKRLDEQIAGLQQARYQSVGTPAEIGERMRGREEQEKASYLASLPGQTKDPGLLQVGIDAQGRPTTKGSGAVQTTMSAGQAEAVKTAGSNLAQAQEAFKKAKAQKGKADPSLVDPTKFDPEYAKRSIDVFKMKN